MEKIVREDTLPRYTQYELSSMMTKLINNSSLTPEQFSEVKSFDLNLLLEVLDSNVVFKPKHYQLVGRALNLTMDEIFEEIPCESLAFFRTKKYDSEVNEFVSKTKKLFKEWVYQEKIYGNIK
ncbi:hypothetical protein [Enterococcus devriesei]|uniref:hypothetical protein n=1 Tax=Enterococcus devriesei TaxID=319970 RepID=UPI0028ACDBBC|nr:hypothetical protein [Enterococcus devriesei]